ncbi:hypothetical protein [Hymenobacter sp. GOD-10R]|uniref:hypothetical protein n=1 Tax=Hymenobacter sp. GOD-10R TaxID=3093922 RepID=UPI002D76FBB9|nr:hypothetical protein [Hymenobacter sp. GOD-10R]WRQ27626.1 hypothetical protein SD425_21380 [Hymenobacter sp. GOD-10R]
MHKGYQFMGMLIVLMGLSTTVTWAQAYSANGSSTRQEPSPETTTHKPAYLRLGVGTTYEITGGYRCERLALEYAPTLTNHLGLASRVAFVFGKPTDKLERQVPNQNYKAGYIEQEAIFYPFGTDKKILFGLGGGFLGYYKKNTYSSFSAVAGTLKDYTLAAHDGFHGGYLLSLNLDMAVGTAQRWRIGLRSSIQNGTGGNTTSPTHSLTFARRL